MAADQIAGGSGVIYLDYQATTPVAPEVSEAMRPWAEDKFANPHSPSRWGREAAAAIEIARQQVEGAIGLAGGSLAFAGGATEALNWALKGTMERIGSRRKRIVTVATEHAAVLDSAEWLAGQGYDLTLLPVGADGLLDLADLEAALDERVAMVAVMLVNNEIGTIQPIAEVARLAHGAGALMLCDAVQGLGRVDIPEGPDLIAVSAHKIHGPKGIGALWMRAGAEPAPLIHGGGQERGLRSGTLSPALCVGFGAAAKLALERSDADRDHVEVLWRIALDALGTDWTVNGSIGQRYHGNLNIRRDGLDGARLISDLRDIALSLGSACASGSGRPSHVLRALGLGGREARSSIRLGFGRYTSEAEIADACRRIAAAARDQNVIPAQAGISGQEGAAA
jgi:cysteine desulfurase